MATKKTETPTVVVTPAVEPKLNVLSIVALVSGIAGLTVLPFVASIVAIITGHMSRAEMRRTGEKGEGFSLAGLIMGYVGIVYGVLLVIFLIFIFGIIMAGAMGSYYTY